MLLALVESGRHSNDSLVELENVLNILCHTSVQAVESAVQASSTLNDDPFPEIVRLIPGIIIAPILIVRLGSPGN